MISRDIGRIPMDVTYHYLGDNMYVFNCKQNNGEYANFFAIGKDIWSAYKRIEESGMLNE